MERVSWVVVSYLIAGTIAAPVYGQLRDVYGGKRVMFAALGVFLAGSVLCAASTSVEMLALARVLQGLGGGGLMTLSQALIGETVPPRERARYQGYLAGVMVTSSAFGPVVGGYLTEHFGWRSVFLVNLPLVALAGLLTLRLAHRPARRQPAWEFDGVGLVLFVAFIVPVLLALEQAQRLSGGGVLMFGALLAIGLAALYALLRAGEAGGLSAVSRLAPAPADHLAQRRAGRLSRRRAGVADRVPADLLARGARHVGRRDRAPAAAAHVRHRRRLDADRPQREPDGLHRHFPLDRPHLRDRHAGVAGRDGQRASARASWACCSSSAGYSWAP